MLDPFTEIMKITNSYLEKYNIEKSAHEAMVRDIIRILRTPEKKKNGCAVMSASASVGWDNYKAGKGGKEAAKPDIV